MNDSGTYECVTKNNVGAATAEITLAIAGMCIGEQLKISQITHFTVGFSSPVPIPRQTYAQSNDPVYHGPC